MADYTSAYTGAQIDAGIGKADTAVQPEDLASVATSGELADLIDVSVAGAADGQALLYDSVTGAWINDTIPAPVNIAAIGYVIDGGGAAITTGAMPATLRVPFACTINSVTLLADQSGSIVVDIWKDSYGNFPPTVADSICASAKPTLSSAAKSEDTTLTGWTTSIAAGDTLKFNVDSASTVTAVTLILKVTKT